MTRFLTLKLYFAIFHYLFACKCMALWYCQRVRVYPYGFGLLRPDRQGGEKFLFAIYSSDFQNIYPNSVYIPQVPYETIVLVARDKVRLLCFLIPHSSSVGDLVVLEFYPVVLTSCVDTLEGNGHHISWRSCQSWMCRWPPCHCSLEAGIHGVNGWISRVNWTFHLKARIS